MLNGKLCHSDGAKAVVLRQCVQTGVVLGRPVLQFKANATFSPRRSSLRQRASVAYRAKPQDAQPSRKKRLQARSAQAQQSGGRYLPALLDRRPASSSRRESRGSSGACPAPRKGPHRRTDLRVRPRIACVADDKQAPSSDRSSFDNNKSLRRGRGYFNITGPRPQICIRRKIRKPSPAPALRLRGRIPYRTSDRPRRGDRLRPSRREHSPRLP